MVLIFNFIIIFFLINFTQLGCINSGGQSRDFLLMLLLILIIVLLFLFFTSNIRKLEMVSILRNGQFWAFGLKFFRL